MIFKYLFELDFREGLENFIKELNTNDPNIESNLTSIDDTCSFINPSRVLEHDVWRYEIGIKYFGSDVKFLLMALSHKLLENSGLISAESYQMGDWWSMQYKFIHSSTIAMTYAYKEGITEIRLFDKTLCRSLRKWC